MLFEARPIFFGSKVAFGDNFGDGARKAAYEPAQIDTQAVVRFYVLVSSTFFFSALILAGMGGMQNRAMKFVLFLAEIACGM